MRAGRISVSSTDAATGTPCSCSIASSRPSSPRLRPRQRMPADQEAPERDRFDRLDFLPQPRQRSLPHGAQHFGVAPLAAAAARAELAVNDAAAGQQRSQRGLDHRDAEAEARADVLAGERSVRAAEPPHQIADRIGHRLEQRHRQARRHRHADRIAIARGILDRDETLFAAGESHREGPPGLDELVDRRRRRSRRRCAARSRCATDRRAAAAGRGPRRSIAHENAAAGAAAPVRACRARIRRADRAARCRRSDRAAAIDRPTAPARGARPAAHRRRRCSWRRSRTAATPRTATASATRR